MHETFWGEGDKQMKFQKRKLSGEKKKISWREERVWRRSCVGREEMGTNYNDAYV